MGYLIGFSQCAARFPIPACNPENIAQRSNGNVFRRMGQSDQSPIRVLELVVTAFNTGQFEGVLSQLTNNVLKIQLYTPIHIK